MDCFKNVNPNIGNDFNRTFNGGWNVPKVGLAIGTSLTLWTTAINASIPIRLAYFAVPTLLDYFRISTDLRVEHRSLEFLDWVIGYRRACAFNERIKGSFQTEEVRIWSISESKTTSQRKLN